MNEVELLFKDKGIPRVGTYVYPKKVAINFIEECRKYKIDILGIDALIIKDLSTEPSMANSIDFTASPFREDHPKNVWDYAISFLKERDNIYYFEIVCQ